MTKFKKCDYCKQSSNKFHKLRSQNDVFKPDDKFHADNKCGGDTSWRYASAIIFLCDYCHQYFFPDDKLKKHLSVKDLQELPELYQLMTNKTNSL